MYKFLVQGQRNQIKVSMHQIFVDQYVIDIL